MTPEPAFRNDSYESYIRKCLVLPSNGSEPRLVDMIIRTATQDDITIAQFYNRTVDLLASYGNEYRKTRVCSVPGDVLGKHVLYFNMSPKLPLNRCVAGILGVDPDELGSKLFWRGDVVVMRFESQDDIYINCQNVDISVTSAVEVVLRDAYMSGHLERALTQNESEWDFYSSEFCNWGSTLYATITGNHPYWGKNWRRQQAEFLDDINELREYSGRRPISINSSYTGLFGLLGTRSMSILKALPTYFSSSPRSPTLPPELERQIFEMCARNKRKTCLALVLVARRVRDWIDPILYETMIFDAQFSEKKSRFALFMANIDCKPLGFYAKHVKNLWIPAADDPDAFERILTICSGVENLVLFPHRRGINYPFVPFLEHLSAGSHLRRLTCHLEYLFPSWSTMQNFQHPCFANLTHLHLYDEDWSIYEGFEHLRSLTHLALSCCLPEVAMVMPKLPALEYVALCFYESGDFCVPMVSNRVPVEVYGIRVVRIEGLTVEDWERGTTGRADFWDLVEREVAMRRAETPIRNRIGGHFRSV